MGGRGAKGDVNRIVGVLSKYAKCGLTFMDLMMISGLSRPAVVETLEILEDSGKLRVKSAGLSRIYDFKE